MGNRSADTDSRGAGLAACSEALEEGRCTNDGGRILVHNLSGRRLCDFPPNADGIGDMSGRDYWID